MSVLIKGMEMPENCQDCTFCDYETDYEESGYYVCHAIPKQIIPTYTERNDDCPLIEIPPHGRLIDKDALLEDIDSNHIVTPSDDGSLVEVYGAEKILAHIAYAPTVIEAEGGE